MVAQTIDVSTIVGLVSFKTTYYMAYSWLFGMSIWVSFFAGTIAYRALPRHQFGALQHRVFPVYFLISILISSGLLAAWSLSHPDIIPNIFNPLVGDVLQAYTLAAVFLGQAANYLVIGPLTTKTMHQRQKQEKEEGKTYNEPGVSAKMKALNNKFGQLHGISSLLNLVAVIALGFHGLWIVSYTAV